METDRGLLDYHRPIPLEIPPVAGWKEVPVRDNGEPLVPMGPFSGNKYDRIFTSAIYFGERQDSPYPRQSLEGSLVTTFAREGAADELLAAEEMLPPGMHLVIYDTYRTLEVQQSLYDQYIEGLKKQHPDWPDDKLSTETQRFVSIPSTNPDRPSPHNTGGALDVAIYRLPADVEARTNVINARIAEIGEDEASAAQVYELEMERLGLIAHNAERLDFGTPWDWGGPEAALNYFEQLATQRPLTDAEESARQNRRLLYNVMIRAGLEPYADEWWHYNSKKTQMGAKTAGLTEAEYGAAVLDDSNREHEHMREQHLAGSEQLASLQGIILDKFGGRSNWLKIASAAAQKIGDFRKTSLPEAAMIQPPDEKAA